MTDSLSNVSTKEMERKSKFLRQKLLLISTSTIRGTAVMSEPQWDDAELSRRVAYEQSPRLRQLYCTFDRAMAVPAVAHALSVAGKAWLKIRSKETTKNDA